MHFRGDPQDLEASLLRRVAMRNLPQPLRSKLLIVFEVPTNLGFASKSLGLPTLFVYVQSELSTHIIIGH